MMKPFLAIMFSFTVLAGCSSPNLSKTSGTLAVEGEEDSAFEVSKSEKEWKEILTSQQFYVLRKAGTEVAFTGKYNNNKAKGLYVCAGCGNELFHSDTKFDSGTGWPSFWNPLSGESVLTRTDKSLFMTRTEVLCSRCGGHLGHVFDDGPRPTGMRYCLNSISLDFKAGKENPDKRPSS
jgi:peptide-methionine (R)-S-oxide reductase